ncbi:MAG: alpha-L-arabinofuranosidase [Gammaproteobacteria bacterium]|nr:MAG: alpha-L-arabinofuranosidase [Gammaproteobacteria bacterium]
MRAMLLKNTLVLSTIFAGFLLISCSDKAPKNAEPAVATSTPLVEQGLTFTNPIIPNGADPWLEYYDGNYYLTTTTWTSQLVMRKSPTLAGLATATPINIWSESEADRCCNFWAFEFHRLNTPNGFRWYVMYTSGTKDNFDGQHLSVIESEGDDPMGPYTYKGSPMPKSWNIDGTYLTLNNQLYLLWSEWQKDEQLIWISKMSNPWTITGERQIISRPTLDWEKSGMKVNEGPEVLQKDGKTFIVFSASFCNTPDYKLGVMELTGADPLSIDAWHKYDKPFFEKANGVFGPGHNGFFTSPDGKENWLVYHGNSTAEQGCGQTRALRAQKFTWKNEGGQLLPDFGQPVASGEKVKSPSGENGPLVTKVHGTKVQLVNKANQSCAVSSLVNGEAKVSQGACDENANWTLDYTNAGKYRLVNAQGLFLSQPTNDGYAVLPWTNIVQQEWKINVIESTPDAPSSWVSINNQATQKNLAAQDCNGAKPEDCTAWRIQPVGDIAISSIQSGKVLSAVTAKTEAGKVELNEWSKQSSQRWNFVHTENGFYSIQNGDKQCVGVTGKSIVPGTGLTTVECGDKSAQWAVKYLSNGTQEISNRQSGLSIDVASCGVANHTPLAQAPSLSFICQQFRLLQGGN